MEKLVKKVDIEEFHEDSILLLPYDESFAKGEISEILTRYITMYSNSEPEVKEHLSDGVHTMDDCVKYIREMARKSAKDGMAAICSDLVFKWLVHYYRCSVKEVIEKEPEKPTFTPSPDYEALKKKREEEEAQRKAEEAEKKRKDEIAKNGLSLFDQLFE